MKKYQCKLDIMDYLQLLIPNHIKIAFIKRLPPKARILDVGCGNNSPYITKCILPQSYYVGIDIINYNQTKSIVSDEYIIVESHNFVEGIEKIPQKFDAVISNHNLEHVEDRDGTLKAMVMKLKRGGLLFLAFPSENSINLPHRGGTLNYYDDLTHKDKPPNFDKIIEYLIENNFIITFKARNYKPPLCWLIGFLLEEISKKKDKILPGTWCYWGFESIIWAKKL